jgi:ABC-2 type transport system permease protein
MRSFSDEFKSGTIELLFTKPLTNQQILLGKFFANWLLVVVCLCPTIIYYFSLYELGTPKGNIDTAAVIGSYLGLLLLLGVFCAVGVWASSLTDNQVIAFVIGVFTCFLLYLGIGLFAQMFDGNIAYWLAYLGLDYHYLALGKGLLDSKNIIYLFSLMLIFLHLTALRLNKKRK